MNARVDTPFQDPQGKMAKPMIMVQYIRLGIAVVMLSLVTTSAIGTSARTPKRHAPEAGCSVSDLRGGYGFVASGNETKVGSFIAAGRLEFDGTGRLTADATVSERGHIVRGEAYEGTYSINPACTGSLTLTSKRENYQSHFDIVLEESGNRIDMIQTDKGNMVRIAARKQFDRRERHK